MREGVQVLQRSPSLGENTVHPSPVSPIRKIVGRLDLSPGKEDWSDQVHESSSKMRRGWSGQAVGLDEENNPSPTRLKRRVSDERDHHANLAAFSYSPLVPHRIAALLRAENAEKEVTLSPAHAGAPCAVVDHPPTPCVLRRHEVLAERLLTGRHAQRASKTPSPLASAVGGARPSMTSA